MLFNPIKDQTIDGLEEWLKNNKPTTIPSGVSTATGYTPPQPSERTQQESKQRAHEVNKLVRAENAAKKAEAKASYQAQKLLTDQKTKREAIEIMKIFKEKANHGDMGRLAKILGVARKTLSNWACGSGLPDQKKLEKLKIEVSRFKFKEPVPQKEKRKTQDRKKRDKNPETLRKRELAKLKKQAIDAGLKEFTATCAKHGLTTYMITSGAARCLKCRTQQQQDRMKKINPNLKKMKDCVEHGIDSFIGECSKHGEAKFYVNKSGKTHVYRCDLCRKKNYKKQAESKVLTDEQRYRRLNREIALTMFEADPNNRTFIGMCLKHGETEFYIKIEKRLPSGVSYTCKACKKNVKI